MYTLKIGATRSEEDAWPIKQSEASEPPPALAPPAAAATGSALRVVDATCACRAVTVEERSLSAAVRLVCFFSAAFAAMFMSRGSVTVPSSAKRPAERDSSQQHAAPRCDAGSTAWDRLVGLDRPDLRAVLGRLVQDQRHRGEGAEWQRVWARLALSEPPERLLARLTRIHAIERFTGARLPR